MKFTKDQIKLWMHTAAAINGHRVGRMKSGRLCIYRRTGDTPRRSDIIITEAQFVKDMERRWH